jgi:hypothetical protein
MACTAACSRGSRSHRGAAVTAVHSGLGLAVADPLPQLAAVPAAQQVIGAVALRHVHVQVGKGGVTRLLARREVGLDAVQCLFEGLLAGDFARHQEAQCVLDAWIIGHRDQSFVDQFGAGFGGDVRAQVGGGLP